MKINVINSINFGRRLRADEESGYTETLKQAKEACGNKGKSVLIVPSSSLPQSKELNTGVGNLASKDGLEFFDFVKKYWGINGVQILPIGQYHSHRGEYPIYSGTSMDLGNHVIDIKSFATEDEFRQIVENNSVNDRVNFSNIIEKDSVQEKVLRQIYERDKNLPEFQEFKKQNNSRLEPKALYQVLRNKYGNYKNWDSIDKNLFNPDIVSISARKKRINEIKKLGEKEIDFYEFKQFLAEKSLKKSREELNKRGLKLYGDMLVGFSRDEVWAHPKAFIKDTTIGWSLPALDFSTPEGEKLLREKTAFYAQRYDGFRIDASWTYISPRLENTSTHTITRPQYDGKILDIIDDEAKKVKGFDIKNIMHEFAADSENFTPYQGGELKPFIKDRVKIYTSEHLTDNWGTNKSFIERGWGKDSFIIGTSNHDSKKIEFNENQAEILAKILKIPKEKIKDLKEFKKAKFAEPMSAYNNMYYFIDALGMEETFQHNSDKTLNYASKVHADYQNEYFNKLTKGEAFNPMDALEKSFISQGLDKENPKLFKEIVKYRKILEENETAGKRKFILKIGFSIAAGALLIYGLCKYAKKKRKL